VFPDVIGGYCQVLPMFCKLMLCKSTVRLVSCWVLRRQPIISTFLYIVPVEFSVYRGHSCIEF